MDRDVERLGNLLDPLTTRLGLGGARQTGKLWTRWSEIVGPEIAAHAQPTSLRDGVLRIKVDSPPWATEISYLVGDLRTKVNRAVGTELVTEIKVWTGPGPVRTARQGPADPVPKPGRRSLAAMTKEPLEAFERARRAWSERRSREGREDR